MSIVTTADKLPTGDQLRSELAAVYRRVVWLRSLIRLADRVDAARQMAGGHANGEVADAAR